ncbi:MAG: hypothetical protein QOH68_2286 [Nocardioidaceae bacterium]|jgi:pimeloyl-ACP methyl ester carboxylesterase|nr:hypothetical protein [Nocardioidaceae bacterium]
MATIDDAKVIDAGGRAIGYYELGDPGGRPVLLLHGTPACGAGFDWADAAAKQQGLRLLAPDRAGIGRSARRSSEPLSAYAGEVASFADALGLDRFAVLGYSGGGPFAMSCATGLGDRASAIGVAAGIGDVGRFGVDGLGPTDIRMLRWSQKRPRLAKLVLGAMAVGAKRSPGTAYKSFAKEVSETDRKVIEGLGPPAEVMALFTEAFAQGAEGVVRDYAALALPWDLDLSAIGVPLLLFHGDADPMVPLAHSEAILAAVPTARLVVFPGEGHLALVTHIDEVLRALTSAA